ncbi:probable Elongin-A at N-terminal half [Coccomyxa sp. Obi]|nr:probable Elongin-A at N-terminal half [Coccomyxa sp. Obi]
MGSTEWIQNPTGSDPGLPRLEQLCYRVLVKYRDWLGDLGDTPLALLQGVLEISSVEKLAEIEDETRLGGRDIGAELAPYWKQWLIKTFGADSVPANTEDSDAGSTDWRTLYEYKMEEYHEREQAVRQRLRRVAAQCAEQKSSRTMQVIEPVPRRHAYKGGARSGFAAPPQSARHRLLKKLGMSAKAPKNKFLIRPVRRIVQPALAQPPTALPPCDKWTSVETCQGGLLVASDLDLPDSTPATRSHTPSAKPAEGPQSLPPRTDNRFLHMPLFERERPLRAQAGVLNVGTSGTIRQTMNQTRSQPAAGAGQSVRRAAAAQPAMGGSRLAAAEGRGGVSRGSHGLDGSLAAHSKRPAAASTPGGPAKRRKPELLSASALAAIAASDGPAASARAVSASGAVRCLPSIGVSNAGGSSRAATGPLGKPFVKEGAKTAPTTGAMKSRLDVEPPDDPCGILVPTDIFS